MSCVQQATFVPILLPGSCVPLAISVLRGQLIRLYARQACTAPILQLATCASRPNIVHLAQRIRISALQTTLAPLPQSRFNALAEATAQVGHRMRFCAVPACIAPIRRKASGVLRPITVHLDPQHRLDALQVFPACRPQSAHPVPLKHSALPDLCTSAPVRLVSIVLILQKTSAARSPAIALLDQ